MLLLLVLGAFGCFSCQGHNITVGVGFNYNFTVNVINDSVTWYTAMEACPQEVTRSDFRTMCTGHCAMGIANTLSSMGHFGSFVWIGRMKAEDDQIYTGGDCQLDGLSYYIPAYENSGQLRCVGFNLSHPEIEFIATDDCHSKHPYICGKIDSLNVTNENSMNYYNVTVEFDPEVIYIEPYGSTDEQRCFVLCNAWFRCTGYIYFETNGLCHHISDRTSSFDMSTQIYMVNSNANTVVRVKEKKRAFIKIVNPLTSRSNYTSVEQNCHVLPETTTTSEFTDAPNTPGVDRCPSYTTPDYRCVCSEVRTPVNNLTLQEWISNMTSLLSVDKKQLSSYTRRLTSAADDRPLSKTFGAFGAIIIITVCVVISLSDANRFVSLVKEVVKKKKKVIKV